jgi:hypothetical protein
VLVPAVIPVDESLVVFCDVGTPPDECKVKAGELVVLVGLRGSRGLSELVERDTLENDELLLWVLFIEGDKDGVCPSDDRSSTLIAFSGVVGTDDEDDEAGEDEAEEEVEEENGEGEEVYVTREIRGSWMGFAITARSKSEGEVLVGD